MSESFFKDEAGAMVADWMIVVAALVGLGGAAALMVNGGTQELASDISKSLSQTEVETTGTPHVGATGFISNLQGIEYASHFGGSAPDGGKIDATTATNAIATMNDLDNGDLLKDFAGLYMLENQSDFQAMSLDIATDLLTERGYSSPWMEAPLYNTTPTKLTADSFPELWSGENPPALKFEVEDALQKYDSYHDLHLVEIQKVLRVEEWQSTILSALMKERGLG